MWRNLKQVEVSKEKIKALHRLGYKQKEIAGKLGVSPTYIHHCLFNGGLLSSRGGSLLTSKGKTRDLLKRVLRDLVPGKVVDIYPPISRGGNNGKGAWIRPRKMEYMDTVKGHNSLLVFRSTNGGYLETFTYAQIIEVLREE